MNRLFPLAVLALSQLTEARLGQTYERLKAGECCPCAGPGSANYVVTKTVTVTQQMPLPTDKSPTANRISRPPARPARVNDDGSPRRKPAPVNDDGSPRRKPAPVNDDSSPQQKPARVNDDNNPQRSSSPADQTIPKTRIARPPAKPVGVDDDDDYDDDVMEPSSRQSPAPAKQTPASNRFVNPPKRLGRVDDGKDKDRGIRYSFNSYYSNSGNLNSGNLNSGNVNSNNVNSNNANSNNANSNNANSNNADSNNADSNNDGSNGPARAGPGAQRYPHSGKPGNGRRPQSPSRLSPGPVYVNSPYGGTNKGPGPGYRGYPRPDYPGPGYPGPGYPGPGYPDSFLGSPFQRPRPFRQPGKTRPRPKGGSPKPPTPLNNEDEPESDVPVSNYTVPKNRLSYKRPQKQNLPTTSSKPATPAKTTAPSEPTTPSPPTTSSSATTSSRPTSSSISTTSSKPKPTSVSCTAPTCGFRGVRYTRYKNPFARDFSSTYKSFELPYFLQQRPLDTGFLGEMSLISAPRNKTYQDAALDIRASLYVCQSGKYKFSSPKSDDISILWLGEQLVQNATRENADFVQAWYGDNSPRTVERELDAGESLPIRVLWGNTNGAGFLNIDIFGPSGKKLTEASKEGYLWIDNC